MLKTNFMVTVNRYSRMLIEYIDNEFKEGTNFRRIILYEDNDDVIMTWEPMYECDVEVDDEDDADGDYDGPLDDEDPDL